MCTGLEGRLPEGASSRKTPLETSRVCELWTDRRAHQERNDNSMDAPEDFAEHYVGEYGVGKVALDIKLPHGLAPLRRGEGLQAPIKR
jgi:hypothetical protein